MGKVKSIIRKVIKSKIIMSNSNKMFYAQKNSEVMAPKKLTVFVSGLNYQTKEEDVKNFFGKCGKIERINLQKQPNNENNLGFCHIIYEDQAGFQNALSQNGVKLDGRFLEVFAAKGPSKIEKIKEKLKYSKNIT